MNNPEIKAFIHQHSSLFWYIPADKKEEISHELLVETIFNYGDLNAVRTLFNIMGLKRLSEIYYNLHGRKKLNYYPEIYHFYSLLIQRYAPSNI